MSQSHQFIISDENSITDQTQFQTQDFDPYGSSLRPQNITNDTTFSLSHFATIQVPTLTDESAQRLSLSLGSHHMFNVPYKQRPLNPNTLNPHYLVSNQEDKEEEQVELQEEEEEEEEDEQSLRFSINPGMGQQQIVHEYSSFGGIIGNSRYLKAAQYLLEEVVNVGGKEVYLCNENLVQKLFPRGGRGGFGLSSEVKAELYSSGLMSLPEKHELQLRIAKLVGLLEEVERRYEKYYNQMEQVVSSFEEIAGVGSAKSYTCLALQAMTRHFGSLQDAIVSQINAARSKLFHDLPKISAGISQLSLFDSNTTRPGSRVPLQQLGLIQSQQRHQTWRPIRGLPETSVATLRTWLFEHFLHPYPNDSEKQMLTAQTGLSKNQVSNWFINARVRLWKPMIEEMYREEFADSSDESNPSPSGGSITRESTSNHAEE